MPDPTEDFAAIVERAQRVQNDIGGIFEPHNPARVAFEGQPNRAGPELDYDAHASVFTLPTDRGEYEDVLNQVLRGEALIRYEERTFSKEGDFLVAICYMTPRERPRPEPGQDAGDAEALVAPRRIP